MSLDWATLRSVAGMTDEIGVLSIYVTLDLHSRAEAAPKPWDVRLRQELAELREQVRAHRPREHWKALTARLDQLHLEIERLRDPAGPGQGRALFAQVAGDEVRTVTLQVPLVVRVVLDPNPYLRPLVEAWSCAGPAGAVSVSADGVKVADFRFELAEEILTIPYQAVVEQRELKGPAASVPGLAQHSAPQHDLYERREDDKLVRFLRTVGPRLADLAKRRGWEYLALTGDAALVQAVQEGLPPGLDADVVTLDHPVNSLPPPRLAATVAPALDEARRRRHLALAERASDAAKSASAGAAGLGETLGALQEGRVAHLLLAADGQWSGSRTPDGYLTPGQEVPPGADPASLTAEPHLDERMIELAFREGGEVTVLEPEAATPLADAGGIGAILRW